MRKSLIALLVTSVYASLITVNASVVRYEDPLRPPQYKIKKTSITTTGIKINAAPAWKVREIIFSGERRVAIINDVAVSRGDTVSGARVIDIRPEHVVLKYKEKTIKSRLRSVSVKKKVKINR